MALGPGSLLGFDHRKQTMAINDYVLNVCNEYYSMANQESLVVDIYTFFCKNHSAMTCVVIYGPYEGSREANYSTRYTSISFGVSHLRLVSYYSFHIRSADCQLGDEPDRWRERQPSSAE